MSLPRYAEYRASGVAWLGEVPGHWGVKRLKHVCEVFPSNVDKRSNEGEPAVRLCNYTDVYYNDRITADLPFMEATATEEQVARFTLRAGDTIITKDSETSDDIAIGAYVPEDLPGVVCGYHLSMVRPRGEVLGCFVKRLFDSAYARASFGVRANGLTRVGLSQYALDNVEVPIPPLPEQQAIAAFLDRETARIDALVAEQERLIALLREKRQALISHAVTRGLDPTVPMKDSGVAWMGEVPAHWAVSRLGQTLAERPRNGVSPSVSNGGNRSSFSTAAVYAGRVNIEEYVKFIDMKDDDAAPFLVARGDLLLLRGSGSKERVGEAGIVDTDPPPGCVFPDILIRLRLGAAWLSDYGVTLLNSGAVRPQMELAAQTAAGIWKVSGSSIRELVVPQPPIREQHAITAYLDTETARIDTLTAAAERAITLLQERRAALISAAVTGQIDVRGLAPAAGA